jgi:hypothetical protein
MFGDTRLKNLKRILLRRRSLTVPKLKIRRVDFEEQFRLALDIYDCPRSRGTHFLSATSALSTQSNVLMNDLSFSHFKTMHSKTVFRPKQRIKMLHSQPFRIHHSSPATTYRSPAGDGGVCVCPSQCQINLCGALLPIQTPPIPCSYHPKMHESYPVPWAIASHFPKFSSSAFLCFSKIT